MKTIEQRFWSKVSKTETCWLWTGASSRRQHDEYGKFKIGRKIYRAHRVSYCWANDTELNEKFSVLHICDNPKCVRPDHLYKGTPQDNSNDMLARGRHRTTTIGQKGENNHNAKLTASQVAEIRERIKNGENNTVIAKDYAVKHAMISRIRLGKSWV